MFCVFGSHVLFESREKSITVLGDYVQQIHPVALPRKFDGWPVPRGNHAARPGQISWFDRYGLLRRPSPFAFFEFVAELLLLVFVSFGG
jgi:hypothetical protein